MTHLVMFDIDGTLVDSARVDSHLPGVRLAIATGGWAETALMKLAAIGVSVDEIGFASSSDARARTRIMELAAQRALRGVVPATRTYLGDGAPSSRASRSRLEILRRAPAIAARPPAPHRSADAQPSPPARH